MTASSFDPGILQDFLTESGELLEQLEGDLVVLERTPDDPELLNKVFRALHTIKGSASFLSLTNLVEIAHAAESALNAARNRVVRVDAPVMTLLLQAVDILKVQMGQVRDGTDLAAPSAELVGALTDVGLGRQPSTGRPSASKAPVASAAPTPSPATTPSPTNTTASAAPDNSVELPPGKADLLEFLVADLDDTLKKLTGHVAALSLETTRAAAASAIAEAADALVRSVDFFEFAPMSRLARLLTLVGEHATALAPPALEQLLPRAQGVLTLLAEQSAGLAKKRLVSFPLDTLASRIEHLAAGEAIDASAELPAGAPTEAVLAHDGVRTGKPPATPNTPEPAPIHREPADAAPAPATPAPIAAPTSAAPASAAPRQDEHKPAGGTQAVVDQTIRVEVGRLETLMNLVGELVLQKNRIAALSRNLSGGATSAKAHELTEALSLTAGTLDRVTGDIQLAVMRTRMQPLDKIFGKYPRLIRDLSMKTGKKLELVIEGGDTEVDKSVIEELGDPLVHLLRNSADHGIEMPADRAAAGKPETGTITLRASHEGSHVLVQVKDNGKGLHRDKIAKKAIERGLATQGEVDAMSDKEVQRFIFEAGFSTADQVTDLSGRGVGMDVVRSNIQKIKGSIDLDSTPGQGTTVSIKIPLTIAIMPAMMVGVADEIYAVPLGNVVEIVKPDPAQISTIHTNPVLRLRDTVLPLVNSARVFGIESETPVPTPFAVVLSVDEKRFGLLVTRLIGQQEIVIKRLDELCDKTHGAGPVSGATVRDDGGVSLIVDVAQLLRIASAKAA